MVQIIRLSTLAFAALAHAGTPLIIPNRRLEQGGCGASLYPDIADNSHAAPNLVRFLRGFFDAKTAHDADAWLGHFDVPRITYIDSTVGFLFGPTNFDGGIRALLKSWPEEAKSYPLRVIGDMNSAVVFVEDTPEMFGTELRGAASLTFENGKVVRQVDYWDGRRNSFISHRVSDSQFPTDFGESAWQGRRNPVIQKVADTLNTALADSNVTAAAKLFTRDAIFEDAATRTRIEGKEAIERYLSRAISTLPYGQKTAIRHVVGNHQGGGYEWISGPGAISHHGILVIELDDDLMISRVTAVWDASRASDATMVKLAGFAIEA